MELLPVNAARGLMALLVATLLLAAPAPLPATPPLSGLQVRNEKLDSISRLNGVPVLIERFTGRDVQLLLDRWLAQWRSDTATVAATGQRSGPWHVHARLIRPNVQEVLQARGHGEAMELLWSRLTLGHAAVGGSRAAARIFGCEQGPQMSGRDGHGVFQVFTDICSGPALRRLKESRRAASAEGACGSEQGELPVCIVPLADAGGGEAAAIISIRRTSDGRAGAGGHR